jgi:hypothetical protein
VNQALVRSVWERANRRCEYCHMPASGYVGSFQVDHIVARQHGGEASPENIWLLHAYIAINTRAQTSPEGIRKQAKSYSSFIHGGTDGGTILNGTVQS